MLLISHLPDGPFAPGLLTDGGGLEPVGLPSGLFSPASPDRP